MSESIHDPAVLVNQYLASTAATSTLNEDSTDYCQILATLLNSDSLSLLQFIQTLGPHITSDSDAIRSKGIQCISETLSHLAQLNSKLFSKQDLSVLLDFLLSKIEEDKACEQFVLQSLTSLGKFDNFYSQLVQKLLAAIHQSYNPKRYLAKVRHELFVLLDTVLAANDFPSSSPLFDDFIKAFIHIATGEKDPRNLMLSFKLNAFISKKLSFDAETHKDYLLDLFDVAFCYFPISFTPPANDPYKITAADLKLSLRAALSTQSLYAPDSFPSLIEKLTSTNPVVRNDVLKTLLECVKLYDDAVVQEHWLTLWNAVKYEILHNDVSIFKSSDKLIITAQYDELIADVDEFKPLIITLDIVGVLTSKCESMPEVIDTIIKELSPILSSVSDKKFKQAVLLLSMTASSNKIAFDKCIDAIFLYAQWGKYVGNETSVTASTEGVDVSINIAGQRDLIDNLGFVFNAYNSLSSFEEFVEGNHLLKYKDILLIFLGQLLQTSSNLEKTLKCKTIQQLKKLILLQGFLTVQELGLIFGWFNDILVNTMEYEPKSWERDIVVQEVKISLSSVMDGTSVSTNRVVELAIESILPTLLNKLPDQPLKEAVDITKILSFIGDLCLNNKFLEILSIRLLNKLSTYSQTNSVEYYIATVESLISSISKTESNSQFLMNSWYKNFVPRFIISAVNISQATSAPHEAEAVVEVSGDLLGLIIRYIEKSQHEDILQDFTKFFLDSDSTRLIGRSEPVIESVFESESILISLFNKVMANINKPPAKTENYKFGDHTALELIEKNISTCSSPSQHQLLYLHQGYLKNLAILFNKFLNDNTYVDEHLEKHYAPISSAAKTNDAITEEFIYNFEIFVWSLKGLVMKVNASGINYLNKLVANLSSDNEDLKKLIARSLAIIFVDLSLFKQQQATATATAPTKLISGVLSFNVRPLYKQRLFESIIPTLIEGFQESTSASSKLSYLVALSNILRNISTNVLQPHLATITPLILTSLSMKDSAILKSSLETCQIVISESSHIIVAHLDSLIPLLVEISTTANTINNTDIRLLSLKCLISIFTKIELLEVSKYQKPTLTKLVGALDDKKRSVRKLACDLRQVLYELGR